MSDGGGERKGISEDIWEKRMKVKERVKKVEGGGGISIKRA